MSETASLLARSLPCLVKLTDKLLERCPFLAKKDGVYAPTVAFIPEKYRSTGAGQKSSTAAFRKWLNIVEKSEEQPEPLRSSPV